MVRTSTAVIGVAGGLLAATGALTLYQRANTEEVPYTVVATVGDAELRRYPPSVAVQTTADSEREAFGRLFRYLSGANETDADLSMTVPVEVAGGTAAGTGADDESDGRAEEGDDAGEESTLLRSVRRRSVAGESIPGRESMPMTAPVETVSVDEGVRMAFFLPADYDAESAPEPTDDRLSLSTVPERTLAVVRFSGRATDGRVARERERLVGALDRAEVATEGEPFFMGYDAPWALPPLRRNEVAVRVADA
jgi:hypothetical protein